MTFTKERLTALSNRENVGAILAEEIAELARIALASLEAEPAIELKGGKVRFLAVPVDGLFYSAPPAPVVPDIGEISVGRLPTMNQDDYPGLGDWWVQLRIGEDCDEVLARVYGATPQEANSRAEALACRAAMLQGAEPVTTANKLPVNTQCKEAPEHIWLQTAGVWPENGEFSELTWCSDNQHEDDTLYVRADVVTGNSPVIPAGWVLVPVEPTEDMIVNGFESEPDESFSDEKDWEAYEAMSGCQQAAHRAKLCWAAMIKAAPKLE